MVSTITPATAPLPVKDNKLVDIVCPAAFAAGVLWIAHYLLQLGFGLATGNVLFEAQETIWWRLDIVLFFGAYLSTGRALIGLSATLGPPARFASTASSLFALIAVVAGVIGVGYGLVSPQTAPNVLSIAGKSILCLFLSALILGGTAFRRRMPLPGSVPVAVLLFGLLTLPMAFVFGIWERTVPSYWVTELHFVFSGAAWLSIGFALRHTGVNVADSARRGRATSPLAGILMLALLGAVTTSDIPSRASRKTVATPRKAVNHHHSGLAVVSMVKYGSLSTTRERIRK